ncbi:MAG: glycosyltransferase [Lyngbya sp. HA4199-MV5]|jgi:glycosyltransferase involved in cell wall biosynthesis|nr:glycosyltransferase [Lyngbya sp. HA4199-MV5]
MQSYQPLVSILINNYNYARYVGDAIDSALGQTYPNIEVIVVDDGSTDQSREVIEGYGDRIIPIFKPNGGQASAMNAGFAASHGDIICLLDADDLFLPNKVDIVVKLFRSHPGIDWVFTESAPIQPSDLVHTDLQAVVEHLLAENQDTPQKVDFKANIRNAELPNFTPSTSNLCFSRALLDKLFPLPEVKGSSGLAICDTYINLLAVGLGTGYVTKQNLGIFRKHLENRYTMQETSKKRGISAEILIATGYWMSVRFPEFRKLSRKLLSKGRGRYLASNYSNADCEKMASDYLSNTSLLETLEIRLATLYCFLKLRSMDWLKKA